MNRRCTSVIRSDSSSRWPDVTSLLGEPHPATSTQAKQLVGVMDKMPAEVRANAERDKTLAWGDDSNFLVVKVNDEGVAWVTAWRSR